MARSLQVETECVQEVDPAMMQPLMKESEGYGFFRIINRSTESDGYGGFIDTYTMGAKFEGVLVLNDSINAQVAMSQGVTGVYKLFYDKSLRIPWHTVFCKDEDNSRVFRVTSKDEKSTPSSSSMDLRYVLCEEWEIPGEVSTNEQSTGS